LDPKNKPVSNLICRRGERTTDGFHSSYTDTDPGTSISSYTNNLAIATGVGDGTAKGRTYLWRA
jgi:hypothetical protein